MGFAGVQMAVHVALRRVNKRLMLNWRPRDENSLADSLTNGDFSEFTMSRRVELCFQDLPLDILKRLEASRHEFMVTRTALVSLKGRDVPMSKRGKEATKTSW